MSASFARTGNSSPLGKLTAEFPKFKGDEETFEEACKLAKEAGLPLSEWLRTLVMIRVHGVDVVANMHAERLRVVAGIGGEHGANGNS